MRYSFEEIFSVSSGLSKKKGEFGTGNPFVSFKEVFDNTFLPKKLTQLVQTNEVEQQKFSVKKGDLFLTRTSEKFDELGMSSIALKDYPKATFNGFSKRLRLKQKYEELFDIKYLAYYMRSPFFRNQIIAMTTMSTRASLNNEMISRLFIDIPNLETQKKISNILYILDSKIELNNQMIATLEELAATLFKRWFVDFEFPDENGNPYKSSGGKMVDSELGEIPEGWEVKEAKKIANIKIGKTPPRKESKWFSNQDGIKWISIADMGKNNIFALRTKENLVESAINKFNINIVPKNTVILSFKLTLGRVNITNSDMVTNEAIAQFKEPKVPYQYLYLYLKQFKFANLGNTSSIAQAVNSKIIKAMPILVPTEKVLVDFENLILSIFEKVRNIEEQSLLLIKQRNLLLPKLISGEVDV
ncbi:type I restriction enzyme, S subunit [Enterococcus sp. DIV0755b]|uniref:restriction endonuclease subunit S n=1 Tax=Enterococcus sp. DIV0755b TaxID=2774657 RepID=UPI003F26582E